MRTLTIICLLLVAIAFGQSLAHALEFPGKLRLEEAAYRTVQQIYYPGFTIGGIAEPVGILALGVLFYLVPYGSACFWDVSPLAAQHRRAHVNGALFSAADRGGVDFRNVYKREE